MDQSRRIPNPKPVTGVGGKGCSCCFPAPGKRKDVYRKAYRQIEQDDLKMEKDYADDDEDFRCADLGY